MFTEYDYANQPIVDIVNDMLIDAAKKRASDIHFDPTPTVLNVRIRVDGELVLYATVPESVKRNLITRIKIISGMNITESRVPQDGAIKMDTGEKNIDFRVSSLPIVYGEKIVIRLLDYSESVASMDSLGFSEDNLEKVLKAIQKPNGIILVTGATGTGKSTTVYSILQRLNTESANVITVEDPVEMNIEGVNQIQTNSEIGLTFATALRIVFISRFFKAIIKSTPIAFVYLCILRLNSLDNTAPRTEIIIRAVHITRFVLSPVSTLDCLSPLEAVLSVLPLFQFLSKQGQAHARRYRRKHNPDGGCGYFFGCVCRCSH